MNPFTFAEVSAAVRHVDGVVYWRATRGKARAGTKAGHTNRDGYACFQLAGHTLLAHRVVWLLEHGEWPPQQINHINGVKTDNRPVNLELSSPRHNTLHAFAMGLASAKGERNGRAKLTLADVRAIRASALSNQRLAQDYQVAYHTIGRVRRGVTWSDA